MQYYPISRGFDLFISSFLLSMLFLMGHASALPQDMVFTAIFHQAGMELNTATESEGTMEGEGVSDEGEGILEGEGNAEGEEITVPSVEWPTCLGGSGDDVGYGIAVDTDGNVFLTGYTASSGWVSGGWDTEYGGKIDSFVVKLTAAGEPLWSTYLGGTEYEYGYEIAVDSEGNCYAAGQTKSEGWVSGGWDTTFNGNVDGYVVKLSPTGEHVWSTYLGGTEDDESLGLALDGDGNIYLAGMTNSEDWISGGWDPTYNGGFLLGDGFAMKLTPDGTPLWSTYLGGTSDDYGWAIAPDQEGNSFISGITKSTDWISGGWDSTYNGYNDGFVVKLSPDGNHLWSSYLGGTNDDYGYGVAVDYEGNCYATGSTASPGWVSGGWDHTLYGHDGYVVKLSTAGAHLWSSVIGGQGWDEGWRIAVDRGGNCCITGSTGSANWASGGWDNTYGGGGEDGYILKLSSTGSFVWSSYAGGSEADTGFSITVDTNGYCYFTGRTESFDWEAGGCVSSSSTGPDIFAMKIIQPMPPEAPSTPSASDSTLESITWTWDDNSSDETGFKVFADPGLVSPVTFQAETAADTESWTYSELAVNTHYVFKVASTNENGDSPKTDICSAWTLAAVPLALESGLPTAHTVSLGIGPDDGNPAYTLYAIQCVPGIKETQWVQSDGALGPEPFYQTAVAWDGIIVTGLEEDSPYAFSAKAKNGAGIETIFGTEISITTQPSEEGEGTVEGEGSIEGEGVVEGEESEGTVEGEGSIEGEGAVEGEGGIEGEGEVEDRFIHADPNHDNLISLSELLRVIQFFNSNGFHCQFGTEDGYAPGSGEQTCTAYDSDYNPRDWLINLSELLRVIQFFNSGGYHYCPAEATEDGFCPN